MSSRFSLIILVALALIGCDKNANSISSRHGSRFKDADVATKALWETATLAIQTNGYLVASLSLAKLHQATLTPEQLQAVNDTALAVSDQMRTAAAAGDPTAIAALAELRKLHAR